MLRQGFAGQAGLNIWKVQVCEFGVVFSSRSIISAGGVGFVGEVAEAVGFFVGGYLGGPFFVFFVPIDAFVF